ncbi:MAG: riboflavin kinase/FMN adenylyltransferase [Chlamydiales bacterium]|jgi:riboflavin kinase/FMN adenylyltransferase
MRVIRNFADYPLEAKGPVVTIGNFDGVHLGHQSIMKRARYLADSINGNLTIITFENHPSQVLRSDRSVELLCSVEHKLSLLEKHGADVTVLIAFDKAFSEQDPETFLKQLRDSIPFTHLILGSDARFGKGREGTPSRVRELAEKLGFFVEYLEKEICGDTPLSSTSIRECIREGNFLEAEKKLGRRYTILSKVVHGDGRGKKLGFPTANINVSGLCLPPFGVYSVDLLHDGELIPGVANLGYAPTVREDSSPVLEVHLFDCNKDLYNCEVEVLFKSYIRPEQKFQNLEDLRTQISQDITTAKESI